MVLERGSNELNPGGGAVDGPHENKMEQLFAEAQTEAAQGSGQKWGELQVGEVVAYRRPGSAETMHAKIEHLSADGAVVVADAKGNLSVVTEKEFDIANLSDNEIAAKYGGPTQRAA